MKKMIFKIISVCKKAHCFWVFDKKMSKAKFLKPGSLLIVNDCFRNENKAVFGLSLQRLINASVIILLCCTACSFNLQESNVIHPAKSLPATMPWNLAKLSEAPAFEWADQDSLVRSLYYEGEPYMGKPTRVFAYYASPATLSGIDTNDQYPAMVLVHGGGGKAFKEWAQLWAERGYAAIAMDLSGCGPDRKKLSDGGPDQSDSVKFKCIDLAPENQWTYHSVANVILAHSLIRTFKEVDATRTAITGISWGGYLTCIVAGLDSRFKAAVPVYGCGFLNENSMWLKNFAEMTTEQQTQWVQLWDPSKYVGSAQMPMFFINGTNDKAYPLDSYVKTYGLVKSNRNFRITVKMKHGHPPGWAPQEIGLFVDSYLNAGTPLPVILNPRLNDEGVTAKVECETMLDSAKLHYTTGIETLNEREWVSVPADIVGNQIVTQDLPNDATIWFLSVTDDRGAYVSSEEIFSDSSKINL
jgi:cephalosporin-C deacetylase-like acetyl esterase